SGIASPLPNSLGSHSGAGRLAAFDVPIEDMDSLGSGFAKFSMALVQGHGRTVARRPALRSKYRSCPRDERREDRVRAQQSPKRDEIGESPEPGRIAHF